MILTSGSTYNGPDQRCILSATASEAHPCAASKPQFLPDAGMRLRRSQVRPFVRIGFVIVQFLAAVGVPDVPPAFRAHGMLAAFESDHSRAGPLRVRIVQQRDEA